MAKRLAEPPRALDPRSETPASQNGTALKAQKLSGHCILPSYNLQENAIDSERRNSPRFSFIARGDSAKKKTDTRWTMRVSEISKTGCYLDLMNPLPNGTPVRLSIAADG
jgi:hypothetical protein